MQLHNTATLLLSLLLSTTVSAQTCCRFTSSDSADCVVYGAIDGDLVAWTKASEACRDAYNIKIASIDVDAVGCGATISTSAFVNAIRFESIPNSVRGGIGTDFFVQQDNGVYVLADSITVDGTTTSCESESDCYTALRNYFGTSTGEQELTQVCETVRNMAAVDREKEQSTVRIQMCQEPTTGASVCGALAAEVSLRQSAFPDKACSAFGIGPGTMALPGCEGADSSTTTSVTSAAPVTAVVATVLAGIMLHGLVW